jgi:hypothetical protein
MILHALGSLPFAYAMARRGMGSIAGPSVSQS